MPEEPTPPTTPIIPQVVTRKRNVMIITIVIAIVAVLLIIIGVALFILWRPNNKVAVTVTPSPSPTQVVPTSSATPTTPTITPAPGEVISPARLQELSKEQNNLAVTITYTAQPQFNLKIQNVTRTYQTDTKDAYAPINGSPFSVLKIYDAQGTVLVQRPFTVATGVIAEGVGVVGGTTDVSTSTAVLQVALPANTVPQKIELSGDGGHIFDSQTVVFDQLPLAIPAQ